MYFVDVSPTYSLSFFIELKKTIQLLKKNFMGIRVHTGNMDFISISHTIYDLITVRVMNIRRYTYKQCRYGIQKNLLSDKG